MRSLLRIARRSILLWFGAGFLAGGLVCLAMGVQWSAREQRYRNHGISVDALVLSKSIKRASRQENSSTRYEITYRFTTQDGKTLESSDAVDVERWEGLDTGSTIRIIYLPGEPQSSRAEGSGDMESGLVAMGLGGLFAVIGGFFFVRSGIKVWREWSIIRSGVAVQGTVTAIAPSSTEINNVRQWEVRYQYRDHFGRVHEGTSGDIAPATAHAVAVGGAVAVRFDRERPEESAWVEPEAPATEHAAAIERQAEQRASFWRQAVGYARMLALVFAVIFLGEVLAQLTGIDRIIARHEAMLLAATVVTAVFGFTFFMGGILYRIFGGGEPMSHADIEDLSRRASFQRRPSLARASAYRFRGKSAGSSFHDAFSIREAKAAWRQQAWRDSPRWRGNFAIMAGAFFLTVGLFGVFIVIGPGGIKVLCTGAVMYALVRTIIAFTRA